MSEQLAYALEQPKTLEAEHYSHSLRALRALGRVSLDVIPLTSDVPEVKEAWTDFVSALEENIATDPELSEKLTFNPLRYHEVVDGHVVDRTGRKTVDLVSDGLAASKQQALFDTRMNIQVERDEADVLVAQAVDELIEGELLTVVSMDPKEALKTDKAFWENKGYRAGMAVLQVYYRTANGVLAGAYAIKDSDTNALREHITGLGLTIPEHENCNRWTRYPLKLEASEEEARTFGDNFVKDYRSKLGLNADQISTTEFIQDNQVEVQSFFDAHVVPVAASTVTGVNNNATRSLADSLYRHSFEHISADERSHLLKVANSNRFTDGDARFMESRIRYALIEHLRPKLLGILEISVPTVSAKARDFSNEQLFRTISSYDSGQLHQMNMNLAYGLNRGAQENRSYGGCASSRVETDENLRLDAQDVFGGKTKSDSEKTSGESDEFGPLEFKCTKGHTNKREKGGWVYECHKCGEDVSCGKKKP